jgi:GDP-L-fucose synthase
VEKTSKIYLAGHRGLAGSAILRRLQAESYTYLIMRTHQKLDLTGAEKVIEFFDRK